MRRASLFVAAVLLSALYTLPLVGQTPSGSAQETPASLAATYHQAMQAKDWLAAVTAAEKLVALSPTAENIKWLGDAQLNAGSANKDTDAMTAALATYDRALAAAQQEKPPEGQPDAAWKTLLGNIYASKGNALLKLRRNSEAIAAITLAAETAPNPGLAYFNLCAVMYNIGDMNGAAPACRKAAQAEPARADAWFLLGSILYANSTKTDSSGKFIVDAECLQALKKYLELAPSGPHADDVKTMLDMAAK
ncbi:MAG: hypothetical protein ACRD3S_07960 [Terracidiphilus sp.]